MSVYRSAILGVGAAAVVAGALSAQVPGTPALPGAPMTNRNAMITPRLEGWVRNADGTATILVGYFNRNTTAVDIPVGPTNQIMPGGPDMGQPTRFLPGRQWGMFSITVPKDFGTKKFTWTVAAFSQPASITLWTNAPYAVSPYLSEFTGNTPPVAKFDPAGPELTGPPKGIAKTYSATVGAPLTLTLWVKDAGPTINFALDPNSPQAAAPARGAAPGGGAAGAAADGGGRGAGRGGDAAGRGGPGGGPGGGGGRGGPGGGGGRGGPGAGGTGLRMSWQLFRGPADVKFANERPAIDAAADGKSETTVTFAKAGEYWLRAQFNDNSGEGGGGDQCCWSSAIVKVAVK